MTERLVIARLGRRGDGIADTPVGAVYVPCTLPGETVEVEAAPGHADRRNLLRVEVRSPDRVAPVCPHFGVCGGCAVQHLAEARYRAWKRDRVVAALADARLDAPVGELVDAHGAGRRRAVFHARRGTHDVLETGFAAYRAHHVVAIDRCPVLSLELAGALDAAWAIAEALTVQGKPLDIQVTATDAGLDVDVRGSGPLPPTLVARLAQVAEEHRLARLTRHGELLAQRAVPTVHMGRASVALPPGAFLQATAAGEAAIADFILAHTREARRVADLFAGVGPFALRLAERAIVLAVDGDEAAVTALSRAAAAAPGLKPVTTERRDLIRRPLLARELERFDAVVFDPPRQGAQAQAHELAGAAVPLLIAVSCNPTTFARDARILVDGGYRIAAVVPIDQFRYSAHVEIAARFERS
ncbi:MAG TPA: RNA methyltransferase [Xanthobacteraceae bacterium]|nr:RNA methyltransferase [Xanthobacteraceae bacterium]